MNDIFLDTNSSKPTYYL